MFRYFRKHQEPKQETSFRRRRKSALSSHSRDGHHAQYGRLKFEPLEPRWMLDSVSGVDNTLYYASLVSNPTTGAVTGATVTAPRQMEYLDRGIVAVRKTTTQVYIGWRLLGTDPSNIAFNLYRSANGGAAVKLNSTQLTVTTDYVDSTANLTQTNAYYVRPVISGVEQAPSESYTLAASSPVQQFLSVPLQIPPGGTTPDGVNYTYSANDSSVGDLDGDGQYEIIVKWDPSNSQDNANDGYTGNVYLDAYKLNGTRLWRIDLGMNIRAGAHYTQFMVYDLDGDGRAEVACKTAPYTKDGVGNYVLLGNDQLVDYRNSAGRILSGPEYLTIFNGMTGAAMATTNYLPARGNVSSWGDSYGNRVDRFLAAVAYLDGVRPSLVMCRGYYTRAVLAAWDWRNGQLTQRWTFDSNTPGNGGYAGQGNHNLSVGDVDGDGKDEIIYGACAIDDNGTGLYTTGLGHGDALQMSDMDPTHPGLEVFDVHEDSGSYGIYGGEFRAAGTGQEIYGIDGHGGDVGRGNAFDIDPNHLGYEAWTSTTWLNPDGTTINYGYIYDAQGDQIYAKPSNMFINFGIWWDADPLRELLDGTTISDWNYTTHGRSNLVYAPANVTSNNSTKKTPCLAADILGDWREEVIWRQSDNAALQIWTTTISATNRMYTLMDDPQYRLSVAWQNVAYNQPTEPGFFLGAIDSNSTPSTPPTPNIYLAGSNHVPPTVIGTTPSLIDFNGTAGARVSQIVVNYSKQLNATDANASGNYELRRAVNGVFGDGNDVVYALTPNYFYNSQTGASTTTFDLGVVLPADTYRLTIRASGGAGGLRDINGNYLDGDENDLAGGDYIRTFTILPVTIAGRYIFYNNSKFDGTSDSGAIATDKAALLPGQPPATFANYTNYSLGINGIIVDIQNLANPGALAASDFQFQVGNGGSWTAAPVLLPPISVGLGQGLNGSDRVTITWDNNVIQNQWLQVTVLANVNTGLGSADVFCFGNAIGESGDNPANAVVDPQDELGSRTHKTGFSAAAIDNHYDYNRDGRVNATDDLIARHNVGAPTLQLIVAPSGAPLAAQNALQPITTQDAIQQTANSMPVIVDAKLSTLAAGNDTSDLITAPASPTTFIHSGGLHTQADLDRMKTQVAAGAHPWIDDWNLLITDPVASNTYTNHATANMGTSRQNADKDAIAAYLNTIEWYIDKDSTDPNKAADAILHANRAVTILNAWSLAVNVQPSGQDIPGLIGIPIFDFAMAAEILRLYPGWATADFNRFKSMMTTYLYPEVHSFLTTHNGAAIDHYWSNWDACNIGALLAMGVLLDDQAIFDEGVNYFKFGGGMGSIEHFVPYLYPGGLGQQQESGRDQQHAQLAIGLLGSAAQVAWNQGVDLFGYANNRFLAAAEYVAQTNLSKPVPYTFYDNSDDVNQFYVSTNGLGRIDGRPIWELLYNHYVVLQGLSAPNVQAMAELLRPELGTNGKDHFGYGTLTFTLSAAASPYPASPIAPVPTNLTATAGVGRVMLQWTSSGDTAQGYKVMRSITSGGPYTTISSWTNLTAPQYIDTSVTNGITYYYVVAANNQSGTSANSVQASARPAAAAALPSGWAQQDIGTVQTAGSSSYATVANNTFIVSGSGSDIGSSADSFQYT